MSRSSFVRVVLSIVTATSVFWMIGCLGQRSYLAGRPVPPSAILERVMVAIQNPSPIATGELQILDARYDIRNSENGTVPSFFISGYKGSLPSMILNYPEESEGYVYGSGDGSLTAVSYATESATGTISGLLGLSSSVFIPSSGNYVIAASQPAQYLTVEDHVQGVTVYLNLPNVYKVEVNPSATVMLAFVQNSNYAYRVIHLQQPNGNVAPVPTFPNEANWPKAVAPVNCQPINLPVYCVVPVLDQNGNPIQFDRPYNTIFSSDGTTGWLLNCGPECGGVQSSVSFLNMGVLNVYNFPGSTYPSPPANPAPPTEEQRIPVPGGATMALYGNNTLYVAGQELQPPPAGASGPSLFEGFLSILNLTSNTVTAQYPISDGTHTKMLFGDDNTLWIGSQLSESGWRTAYMPPLPSGQLNNGALTMFNLNDNSVLVEPPYGDLTGLCAILQWHKMYTAYGGQIHIYATTNQGITTSTVGYTAGSELYNGNATVQGTAYDVAYMDAITNASD
ncbi:MAG: hypothetical protein WA700_05535 [Acidobacteriaceae bacterium]